jgi:glycosyltransferase involved in cell wall biosynthesis
MKIVMFAINPLYPDHVLGGAPKHLYNIAIELGEQGHDVQVFCTWSTEAPDTFEWHHNVTVLPKLRFKLPFPQPYDIPAYHFAQAIETLSAALAEADRFYMHDGEFLFPKISAHVPTVVSLRDNVYPETMIGAFNFHGDDLICISDYSADYYTATVGRFYPGFTERLHVVPNGIDWERFTEGDVSEEIQALVGIDASAHAVVLHPHRPESSKGLARTINVADKLVHDYAIDNLRVLIPRWEGSSAGSDVQAHYEAMMAQIAERGLQENFIFHPWVPQSKIHEYYRMGDVLFTLGYFQEAFGNVPYESLACGTPAIVARTSTHRSLLPDYLIDKVHYGDDDAAASTAATIIKQGQRTPEATLVYMQKHFSKKEQVKAYAKIITDAQIRGALAYKPYVRDDATRYELAPWCYVHDEAIFNDYTATYHHEPELVHRLKQGDICGKGSRIEGWYKAGLIVPSLGQRLDRV